MNYSCQANSKTREGANHPERARVVGISKKLAAPSLGHDVDTFVGTLDYGKTRVAVGSMGYKHRTLPWDAVLASMKEPNSLLKIIPHVDGSPRIRELVRYYLEDIDLKGAWTGPGALELDWHALVPIADLPVREVVSATHILADLTLGQGEVVFDYLAQ